MTDGHADRQPATVVSATVPEKGPIAPADVRVEQVRVHDMRNEGRTMRKITRSSAFVTVIAGPSSAGGAETHPKGTPNLGVRQGR